MVRRIIKLFHQEFGGLHKAAALLAFSAGASALLGLFRDRLLAGTFGAGRSLDIYYASFRVPDLLYNVVALSLVSVTVLIPLFLEKLRRSEKEAYSFLNGIFTVFLALMSLFALILFFLAPLLAPLVAPGFSPAELESFVLLTRIMLFSSLLLGLSNLLSSVIQSFRRFFIYALSPVFYNFGIILGIVFLFPLFGFKGLAMGVVLGALLHVSIQIPGLMKLGFSPKLAFKIDFSAVKKVMKLSLPRSLGLGMHQIVLIFITAIASGLAAGSIAVFNLSLNLQSVVLAVIGVSYSVAAFPALAKLFVDDRKDEFLNQALSAARQIIFWSVPASALFIVLRAQIVRVILGTGVFSWTDTRLVAASLAIFSVSICSQALIILFVRAFYAAGKTAKPLAINVFSFALIIISAFLLVRVFDASAGFRILFEKLMRVEGVEGTNMLMLPLAFSAGMVLNAVFLIASFSKMAGVSVMKKLGRTLAQALFASALAGTAAYLSLRALDGFFNLESSLGVFAHGFISGVSGVAVWFAVLRIMGSRELGEIIASLKGKFWKTPVIAPGPEEL